MKTALKGQDINALVSELNDLAGGEETRELTGSELSALRTYLNISVKQAMEFIDDVRSKRSWYYYEEGRNPVPAEVVAKMFFLLNMRQSTLTAFLNGDYEVGQYQSYDAFKADVESATEIRWALHQSAEAEFVAKSLNGDLVPPVTEPCRATALYHDGKNNFQVNYGGSVERIKESFIDEMTRRKAIWATLHRESDGALIDTFKLSDYIEEE